MGLDINSQMIYIGRSAVDLTLSILEAPRTLYATLEYNTDLFDAAMMERMLKNLQTSLAGIVAAPEQRLLDLPFRL